VNQRCWKPFQICHIYQGINAVWDKTGNADSNYELLKLTAPFTGHYFKIMCIIYNHMSTLNYWNQGPCTVRCTLRTPRHVHTTLPGQYGPCRTCSPWYKCYFQRCTVYFSAN
jgi:hypothetical protein